MTHLQVYRSATRELLMLATGILLIVAALDVVWLHQVSGPPEFDDTGQTLTSRGQSQRRTDLIWGSTFVVFGGGLALVAIGGLAVRRPVVAVRDDGLELRIAGPRRTVEIPWADVSWVHSGTDGEDESVPPRVFLVHVVDRSAYPDALWAAAWDGSTLMVDADAWSVAAEEVVTHARMALDAWRRDHRSEDDAPLQETT